MANWGRCFRRSVTVVKPDRRGLLHGHELEVGDELVTRDVNRTMKCTQCGGRLEVRTVPMTGRVLEECRHCGTSEPVHRFTPIEESKDVDPRGEES